MAHQMVMVFRRSPLNPVNSVKHIVDVEGALSGGVTSVSEFATTVNALSASFNPVEVTLGSKIYGFFLSIFVIGATGAPLNGAIDWYIAKVRQGQSAVSDFPNPQATGISPIRSQIIHQEKGLAGSGDGTPMAFKGVIKVPKGMQRCRDGDSWVIKLRSGDATNDATFCIKIIHKTFR